MRSTDPTVIAKLVAASAEINRRFPRMPTRPLKCMGIGGECSATPSNRGLCSACRSRLMKLIADGYDVSNPESINAAFAIYTRAHAHSYCRPRTAPWIRAKAAELSPASDDTGALRAELSTLRRNIKDVEWLRGRIAHLEAKDTEIAALKRRLSELEETP